jgi:hypothetical protein
VRNVWVDSQSFLEVKMNGVPRRLDGKPGPVQIYLRDYGRVNGLMVPHALETVVHGFKPSHKIVSVNTKLEDSPFEPTPAPIPTPASLAK